MGSAYPCSCSFIFSLYRDPKVRCTFCLCKPVHVVVQLHVMSE